MDCQRDLVRVVGAVCYLAPGLAGFHWAQGAELAAGCRTWEAKFARRCYLLGAEHSHVGLLRAGRCVH